MIEHNEFSERFSSDGFCLQSSVDFISHHIGQLFFDEDLVTSLRSDVDILNFLSGYFNVCLYVPKIFMLYPPNYLQFIKSENIVVSKKIFMDKIKSLGIQKKAILYHAGAIQLYGINELWTHYVVELFEENQRTYYDSYQKFFYENHPSVEYIFPSHNELINLFSVKFLIYRRSNKWKKKI